MVIAICCELSFVIRKLAILFAPLGDMVIDIGMTRVADGQLYGDVEFSRAIERASWITPVPGGVGPMTVVTLMENTLEAAETFFD